MLHNSSVQKVTIKHSREFVEVGIIIIIAWRTGGRLLGSKTNAACCRSISCCVCLYLKTQTQKQTYTESPNHKIGLEAFNTSHASTYAPASIKIPTVAMTLFSLDAAGIC